MRWRWILKRAIDVTGAALALIMFAPLMAAVALLVYATSGPPILFRQLRPGLHGKPFQLYKFRTMTEAWDGEGRLLPDEQRLTRLGRWLRASSLDELPELWNVLKGDMSLVGPRPLLLKYLPYFTEREWRRFQVRPGITGIAQISGRNQLPWSQRLELDVWYVENWSLILDIRIMWVTLVKILRREGVVELPRSRMPDLDEERGSQGWAS